MQTLSDGDHVDATFEGVQQPRHRFGRATFERCRFVDCVLTGASFTNVLFADCVFTGCELSMITVPGTSFNTVRLQSCRAMGVNWTAAQSLTFSVEFEGCRLDNSVFAGMRLWGLSMTDCNLRGADLSGCDLTGARFSGSDLSGAGLRHAILRSADLSEALGFAFDARTNKAGKTRISLETAAQVLAELGLVAPELER